MALFDEASPICRGKNLSWETVLLFYNNMPRKAMPKAEFHSFTEAKINGWKQTHSQIARQLAFYYEENGICYPRFTNEISYADLFAYMQNWAAKYFIPNPYAPSLKNYAPTCIYAAILKAISSGETKFDTILDSMFGVELSSHDKVRVYLSNFTNLIIDDNNVSINDRTLGVETILYPEKECAIDVKKYFDYFSIASKIVANKSRIVINNQPLQQIYYGAPGTGKSHEINRLTEGEEVIRTTFHPDSDYSTFVGCYKPHMEEVDMTTVIGKELIVVKDESGQPKKERRIVYKYSCQAFLQAYIAAWQHPDRAQYLVIEEINRGNCAQIFGDIFQLLDRNDEGYSSYPIKTDADAENELRALFSKEWNLAEEKAKEIDDLYRKHYPDGITKSIKDGSILLLPSNLYIWATMNTSDQSLFPIDSAFKRRWDWKYVKIAEGRDSETKELLNWVVKFDYEKDNKPYAFECSWWQFILAINEKIANATSSDDKKLGYFFCKPKTQDCKEIDAERFVGKVVFYLWNDVFKDEDNTIFKVVEGKGDPSFDTFYTEDDNGKIIADTKALRAFMHNVFGEQSELYTETAKDSTDTEETATE
ncbi:hypothetical protein [Prevotella sp. E13-27]|uniref:hypothetical protein n=1 Tax=Prevotella sp. E13-27 TaxID=2938122 RepID=UPI00200A9833|nr:hypothetical protein [Prevotella sp. E13-27]MCK8620936.1 hypothetical protein [Prevotella sp. E13-27]